MNIFFHSGINLDLSLIEIKSIFNNKIKDEQIIIDHRNNIISIELELSDEEIINLQNKLG